MKGSSSIFDHAHLFYQKCDAINSDCGGSYICSPNWIKNKKVTINPINKNNNECFQYAVALTSSHEEIGKDSGRITEIKPVIDIYNLEEINYPSEQDD